MKCRWKYCKLGGEVNEKEAIQHKKGYYYHSECHEEFKQLEKIKDLYAKYYNKNENWAIIMRTLNAWIKKYGVEFILFCLCKAIRNNIYLRNFLGLYYVLTDKKYIDEYSNYKKGNNDPSKLYGDYVLLSESEYYKLINKLGEQKTVFYINKLNNYIKSTGKEYTSHYETILLWKDRDDENKPINTGITIHDS